MIVVLDAAFFLNQDAFFDSGNEYFVSPAVVLEIKSFEAKEFLENALRQKTVRIREPDLESSKKAEYAAKSLNDKRLSRADLEVCALALDLGKDLLVYTDDFSLQNLLKSLRIPFKGVFSGEIQKVKKFKK